MTKLRTAPRHVPIWLAIAAASLPMFMATLDNLVVTSALPVIHRDTGTPGPASRTCSGSRTPTR